MVTSSDSDGSFGPDEINHRSILQACRITDLQVRGIGRLRANRTRRPEVHSTGRLKVHRARRLEAHRTRGLKVREIAGHATDVREGAPVLRAWPVGVERPHVAPRGI